MPLAVVTGAASRVGKQIALHLASQGYAIGLHFHTSETEAQDTANELRGLGIPVYLLNSDLSDPQAIQRMFKELDEIPNPLRVLVNSAAIMTKSDLMKMDWENWDTVMNLNVRSVWLTSREAARRMRLHGVIINISDVGAHKTWTSFGAYAVSKAAVETLTRLMAKQLAPNIRVNAIAPGLLLRGINLSQEEWQGLVDKVPMKRATDIGQFLTTLDFLLTNEYITGEVITIAGGYQLV